MSYYPSLLQNNRSWLAWASKYAYYLLVPTSFLFFSVRYLSTGSAQYAIDQSNKFGKDLGSYKSRKIQDKNFITSNIIAHATPNAHGSLTKYFWRFQNVKLTKKTLYVYLRPDAQPPTEEYWVDFVSGNTSSPAPPTMIVIKGTVHKNVWYYLKVQYLHQRTMKSAKCKKWEEKPTFFMQVRYSTNIWHTWNEGIMSAFQTLRELGYLPLARVHGDGSVTEVVQGMGNGCLPTADVSSHNLSLPTECPPKTGTVAAAHCDVSQGMSCIPGVYSYDRQQAPLLLPYLKSSMENVWTTMYDAMTSNVRYYDDVDGTCFRELIIGKTSTLNFYQALNANLNEKVAAAHKDRVEALSVVTEFAKTQWKATASAGWKGYDEEFRNVLRKGIGPEQIEMLDSIIPTVIEKMDAEEMKELADLWTSTDVEPASQLSLDILPPPSHILGFEPESPRPVVTYITRASFSRGIVNEHLLLKYILNHYNVTLRVTTCGEPTSDVAQLLSETDVLIAMHGAAWTNGLFLKEGAGALQLYPYGWQLPDGSTLRGFNYREIVLARRAVYKEWINTRPDYAFLRRSDFFQRYDLKYQLHPHPEWPLPHNGSPGNIWVYQNTFVDMESLAPILDELMAAMNIRKQR